ncbi:hypothetical protein, partial [Fischerella thermalis]|uniref:hypothetical protein n=1 Tax=Fischerella thermalis TaxID=372787 RepID=UPI001CA55AB1
PPSSMDKIEITDLWRDGVSCDEVVGRKISPRLPISPFPKLLVFIFRVCKSLSGFFIRAYFSM